MHATDLCGASFEVQQLPPTAEPTTAAATAAVAAMLVGGQEPLTAQSGSGRGGGLGYGSKGKESGRFLIRCHGIGFTNTHLG